MNIFTVNQVNQVYVLKPGVDIKRLYPAGGEDAEVVDKSSAVGTVGVGKTPDGKYLYFKHRGAGGVLRSDLIEIKNIIDYKATPAAAMARKLLVAKVTLNSEALASSAPIAGEDYVLRIKFQNPIGMSPDNQYWKYGVVHATSGMSASDFYKALALSVAKNMSREEVKLVSIVLTTATTPVEVLPTTDPATLTGTYTGLLISEVEQDWLLGIKQQKPLIFTVEPTGVNNGTDEVTWGDVIYSNGKKVTGGANPTTSVDTSSAPTTTSVVNSKLMADYEYFFMGERGDQYRMVGFPDYVPTTYLVDPSLANGYDVITLHYAYVGDNHSVQKSEKDITFIVPRANSGSTIDTLAGSLDTAIKAVATNL